MRKRHLFTLLFLSTLVGMTSCDDSFLDQTVTTDLDETTVLQTVPTRLDFYHKSILM